MTDLNYKQLLKYQEKIFYRQFDILKCIRLINLK